MVTARNKAILSLCLLAAAFAVIFSNFRLSTDLAIFLPDAQTRFDKLLRHQLDNGASSNIIFIAFSGRKPRDLAEFNQAVAGKLRESGTFSKVTNNASSLGDDALAFLEENRYLLSHNDLSRQFSVDGMRTALEARLEGLASATAPLEKKFLRQDPTGEILALLTEWQGKISRHKRPTEQHGVWFSDDLSRSLIILEVAADISRLKNQTDAVMEIREVVDEMAGPGLETIMTGPAVFAVESSEDIRSDVKVLTLVAVVLVLLFLFSAYRSPSTVLMIACPLAVGVVVATATILLFYGQIHGITLAFGMTLAGVAVDYPIHILTGLGPAAADNEPRTKKIWRTLRLGVLSTIIAYAAFLLSGFRGLQQLGLFTIIGLIAAAYFSRWVLPFIASHCRHCEPGLVRIHGWLKAAGRRAARLHLLVVAALVVSLASLIFTERPIMHLNVDSLSPINAERRSEGRMLRGDIGFWYGGSMMLATATDKEGVLQFSEELQPKLERLAETGDIEGYDMAAHFLPSIKRQTEQKARAGSYQTIRANLETALADMPFRDNVFEPFLSDIQGLAEQPLVDTLAVEKSPVGKKLDPLLFDFEGESAGVILLHGVKDGAVMQDFADRHEGLYYMHLKSASTDLVKRSVDRVSQAMLICIAVIYLAMAATFRSLRRPLKIMVPTFAAATTAAAILVHTGNPLSLFHLISLMLVVGLGLDYALFFNRLPDNKGEWETTFRALWTCAVTTILVFGILMYSRTPPLEAIGLTVAIGAFLSIVFAAMWATRPETRPLPAVEEAQT